MHSLSQTIRFFIFSLLLAFSIASQAQVLDSIYFKDGEKRIGLFCNLKVKYENNLILAGGLSGYYNNYAAQPEMVMVDSNLNLIWKLSDQGLDGIGVSQILLGQDNYLYIRINLDYSDYMVKVDPSTGQIIWKSANRTLGFFDKNTSPYILDLGTKGIGVFLDNRYMLFDRMNGNLVKNTLFTIVPSSPNTELNFFVQADADSVLYIAKEDTLYKINIRDTAAAVLVWKRSYEASHSVFNLDRFFIRGGSLLLFANMDVLGSSYDHHSYMVINKSTGNIDNITKLNYGLNNPSTLTDVIEKDSFFYATFKASYSGGSYVYPLAVSKIKKNAVEIWAKDYFFKENGYGLSYQDYLGYYGNWGANCITIDNADDLYVGGYAREYDFLYFKLNGLTGDTIYKKIVTDNPTRIAKYGRGATAIDFLGSSVVCAGAIELNPDSLTMAGPSLHAVKFTPSNGSIQNRLTIYANTPPPSSTLKIVECDGGIVSLQQWGRKFRVQKMDTLLNVLWSKQLNIDTNYNPPIAVYNIFVGDNEIYVTGKKTPDTLVVFRLDNTGMLTGTFLIYDDEDNRPFMLDVVPISYQNALVFYSESNNQSKRLFTVKLSGAVQSSPLYLGLATASSMPDNDYMRNQTFKVGNDVYYYSAITNIAYLNKINYTTLNRVQIAVANWNQIGQYSVLADNNKIYVLTAYQLYKYDLNTLTKEWSTFFSNSKETVFLLKKLGTHMYVAGINNTSKLISLYCLTSDSGAILWSYLYPYKGDGVLTDMEIDSVSGSIVLTGRLIPGPKDYIFYLRFNLQGQLADEYKSQGYGQVSNSSNDLLCFNGIILMGGNLNRNHIPFGNEGFLYRMNPNHLMEMGPLQLKSPATDTKLALQKTGTVTFKWTRVLSVKNYAFSMFSVKGNIVSRILLTAPANAQDTFITFDHTFLDSLLNVSLVQYGDSINLKWDVVAYNIANDSSVAQSFNLTLVRYPQLSPFTPVFPAHKNNLIVKSGSLTPVLFNWKKSKNANTYRWYIQQSSAPYSVISTGLASNSGKDTLVILSSSALYAIYTAYKGSKDSVNIRWHIVTRNSMNDSISSDTFVYTLKALKEPVLVTPVNNIKVVTESGSASPLLFNWTNSNALYYTFMLSQPGGSFIPPSFKTVITDTALSMTSGDMDSILNNRGIVKGDSTMLTWTVIAHSALDTFKVRNDFTLLCHRILTLGIAESTKLNTYLYPNPFNLYIQINTADNEPQYQYTMSTVQGQVMLKGSFEGNRYELNTSNIPSGFYFLNIQCQNKTITYKILKH